MSVDYLSQVEQTLTADIFGQSYTVRSDDEPGVRRAAAAVDQFMQDLAQRTRTRSPFRMAVCAALYFAYEVHKSG